MIQGLHYKQINERGEPMLQNNKPNSKLNNKPNNKLSNKPNNKLNNKLDLKKRLFSMLLVLALLSGSVSGALPAAAVTTDGYVASETGGRSFRFCPPVSLVSKKNMGTVLSVLSPCSPGLQLSVIQTKQGDGPVPLFPPVSNYLSSDIPPNKHGDGPFGPVPLFPRSLSTTILS